jgi:hypothetical protein
MVSVQPAPITLSLKQGASRSNMLPDFLFKEGGLRRLVDSPNNHFHGLAMLTSGNGR